MIIFDMDGTLWETTDITLEAANDIAKEYNEVEPVTKEIVESGMGLSKEENAKLYMPYLDEKKGVFYIEMISERCSLLINEKGANLYDGVLDVIKELSNKYKLGIITNNYDEYVEAFFNNTGLKEYFSDYIGTASYSLTKAEAIRTMMARNNEKNGFYIGDIKKDMESAKEAGIGFIHAKYGFEPHLQSDLYINDIRDLEELVSKVF